MTSLPAVLSVGAALGGVLALAGSWSRGVRPGRHPHLSAGGAAAVGAAVVARTGGVNRIGAVGLALVAGAACGLLLEVLERRLTAPSLPLAPDLAGLALLVGVAALVAPGAVPGQPPTLLGAGPATAGTWAAAAVLALGAAAAAVLALLPGRLLPIRARWGLAGAGCAGLAGVAVIALAHGGTAPYRPDALALALAAGAAAACARTPLRAAAAGVAAGAALALLEPLGVPPAVAVGALALGAATLLPLAPVGAAPAGGDGP